MHRPLEVKALDKYPGTQSAEAALQIGHHSWWEQEAFLGQAFWRLCSFWRLATSLITEGHWKNKVYGSHIASTALVQLVNKCLPFGVAQRPAFREDNYNCLSSFHSTFLMSSRRRPLGFPYLVINTLLPWGRGERFSRLGVEVCSCNSSTQ